MSDFVRKDSIVRAIWGKADTVLFIFAGAAAEFALNKAVDWLYFTGKLPSDPIGRLFSTVQYARWIVFSPSDQAHQAIDSLRQIHSKVEQNRGASIPDWAYRDVLFMLVHYSIAAYELLEKKLNDNEKQEVYDVFYRVGLRMGIEALPGNFNQWQAARETHLAQNLQFSPYTADLFAQYRKHLGPMRYKLWVEGQKLVVPEQVSIRLNLQRFSWLTAVVPAYKLSRLVHADKLIKALLLPPLYKKKLKALDCQD